MFPCEMIRLNFTYIYVLQDKLFFNCITNDTLFENIYYEESK